MGASRQSFGPGYFERQRVIKYQVVSIFLPSSFFGSFQCMVSLELGNLGPLELSYPFAQLPNCVLSLHFFHYKSKTGPTKNLHWCTNASFHQFSMYGFSGTLGRIWVPFKPHIAEEMWPLKIKGGPAYKVDTELDATPLLELQEYRGQLMLLSGEKSLFKAVHLGMLMNQWELPEKALNPDALHY